MALKALMLRSRINAKSSELAELQAKDADFANREKELRALIEEAKGQGAEERAFVEAEVDKFDAEQNEHEKAKAALENSIKTMEAELEELEAKQEPPGVAPETGVAVSVASSIAPAAVSTAPEFERKDKTTMKTQNRDRFFGHMNVMERHAFVQQPNVQAWLSEVRAAITEKRALSNVGVTIPTEILPLLRENLIYYSKLYRHVNVTPLSGDAMVPIMGTIPEGVWTDCCATLNELDLGFYGLEMNCYKVGGFFAVCNAIIEDSDIDLLSELMVAIDQAIGLALDKAIVYGRNAANHMKMPQGFVSRLLQTAAPDGYPAFARPWANLSATNVLTIAGTYTGVELFQQLVLATGAAKGRYSRGEKVWIMNETTYTYLLAQALNVNGAGAIVSVVDGRMPVIGGIIEVLGFMPDYVIAGGYMDLYRLAERRGVQLARSEHVRFIQDQTVIKGTARYDGAPAIAEAFVVIGLNGVTPTADMPFAPDTANDPPELSALSLGTAALTPGFSADVTSYTASTTNSSDAITATPQNPVDRVSIVVNGTVLQNGASATWNDGANVVSVTVTSFVNGTSTTYTVNVTKTSVLRAGGTGHPVVPVNGGSGTPVDAPTLSALSVGSAALTPEFSADADVMVYAATTTNAKNKITATPENPNDLVTITVNGVKLENDKFANWNEGVNLVTIEVKSSTSGLSAFYNVNVTKTS